MLAEGKSTNAVTTGISEWPLTERYTGQNPGDGCHRGLWDL